MVRFKETLVGRDAEIETISVFLDDVPAGPVALQISGEPGIGKTTLLKAGLRAATDRKYRVLACHPAEADRRLSFGGLGDLLRDVLAEALPGLPPPQRRAIETALLLEESAGPPPDQRAIAIAFLGVLQLVARSGPVLVALDDVQWLDRPSTSVLAYALRRLGSGPVGLLATTRTEGVRPDPLGLDRSMERNRNLRVSLGPLSLGALHRLLVERLGRALSRPALVRVHKMSGGNPFYALEIARALLNSGDVVRPGEPLPVPEDLEGLLRGRLAKLLPAAREVLAVVASLADPTITTVERAVTRRRAAAGLEAAVDGGILEVNGDQVRFTHPLLASAVYNRQLPGARRELHRRLASVVHDSEERARHLALGSSGRDADVADALDIAASHASARGAPDVAGELEELATGLTPLDDVHEGRRRTVETARYRMLSGEYRPARTSLEVLLEEPLSQPERADVLLLLSEARADDFVAALDLAEQAAVAATGDTRRLIRIGGMVSDLKLALGDVRTALVDARRVLKLAERQGDPGGLLPALARVATVEMFAGPRTPGLLEKGVALEEGNGNLRTWESPRFVLAFRLMLLDRLDESRTRFEAILDQAVENGDEDVRMAVLLHRTELECRAGNFLAAADHAAEMLEAGIQSGLELQGGSALYPQALVDAYLGRVDEARAVAEKGVAISEMVGDEVFRAQSISVLGFLELSLGDPAAADHHLRPLADRLESLGWGEPSKFRVLPNAIEALVALGELDEARRLLHRLETRGREAESTWAEATAGRCRGLIRAAEGDLPGALAGLEEALQSHARIPGPFERARTLLVLGSCQRRAKKKGAARRSIEEARDAFRELGASLWLERAEAELRKIGGRAPAPLELTPAERQVASLVAEGLSNREIADRLFVSVRTVEGHLSSTYRKFGVRSRTELAVSLGPDAADLT